MVSILLTSLSAVFWVWKATTSLRVFDRERADRLYGVAPYVLSDFVSFLVPSVISSILLFVCLLFFLEGLQLILLQSPCDDLSSVLLFCLAGLRRDTYVSSLVTFAGTCVLSQFVLQGPSLRHLLPSRSHPDSFLMSRQASPSFRPPSSGTLRWPVSSRTQSACSELCRVGSSSYMSLRQSPSLSTLGSP